MLQSLTYRAARCKLSSYPDLGPDTVKAFSLASRTRPASESVAIEVNQAA